MMKKSFLNISNLLESKEPVEDLTFFNGSWKQVSKLIGVPPEVDWRSNRIGTFYVKLFSSLVNNGKNNQYIDSVIQMTKKLEDLFSIPEKEINLPLISHLFSILNIDVLKHDGAAILGLNESQPGFVDCFMTYPNQLIDQEKFFYETSKINEIILPCLERHKYPKCQSYCKWHQNLMQHLKKEALLVAMKYSMPQEGIFQETSEAEEKLAKEIFGEVLNTKALSKIAPSAMPIFCFIKGKGFLGSKIGFSTKACNDFQVTPSDLGLVLTQNFDLFDVMHVEPPYDLIFQQAVNKDPPKIEGGNYWSEVTLVFNTNAWKSIECTPSHPSQCGNNLVLKYPKSLKHGMDEIQLQLHSRQEIAKLSKDSYKAIDLLPLDLKSGHEYFIDVTLSGQESTDEFKALRINQRNCFLANEGLEKSIFKKYTESNCKYECHIKIAREACKCHPWDYFIKENTMPECDVFGRTCFINTMEQLAISPKVSCQHCIRACDVTNYHKTISKVEKITGNEAWGVSGGKYFIFKGGKPVGSEVFIDYIMDSNDTLYDKGLKNAFKITKRDHELMYGSLILVHLRFKDPFVFAISPKYSVGDLIANFGGQFGLFEQVTGASFLGLVYIFILLLKLVFLPRNQ